jgi:hypothetical protein|tara:strand:- start:2652 stop:2990 length:339 start_codon:yes stop_codon:yes gene_type:complete
MAKERVRIQRQSYKREQIRTSLDTEFNVFKEVVEEQDTDTVEELFRLYDKLFYSIPIDGENRSHTYILERSSELADFDKSTEEIQPLLDEITQLREQLLDANQQIFDLQNQL